MTVIPSLYRACRPFDCPDLGETSLGTRQSARGVLTQLFQPCTVFHVPETRPRYYVNPDPRAAWHPFGAAEAIPSRFTAEVDDPASEYLIGLVIVIRGGQPEIDELLVQRRMAGFPFGVPVASTEVKKINVMRYLRGALAAAVRPRTDLPGTAAFTVPGTDEDSAWVAPEAKGPRSRPADLRLQEVADTYREALKLGASTRELVAERLGISPDRAKNLIVDARKAKLLGPAPARRSKGEM